MSLNEKILIEIANEIENAEKVLVGIGLEWQMRIEAQNEKVADINLSQLMNCEDIGYSRSEKNQLTKMYDNLKKKLGEKDYFIISLCYDDMIYDSFSHDGRVVTPCGGYKLLQCGNHIMTRDEVVVEAGELVCPICKKRLSYNNIHNAYYMEDGYLPKFMEYKEWLQSTINKKLLILELGADMRFPQVMRFAFDRLVKYNLKSKMYRINKSICMVDSSSDGRAIAVESDSRRLIELWG